MRTWTLYLKRIIKKACCYRLIWLFIGGLSVPNLLAGQCVQRDSVHLNKAALVGLTTDTLFINPPNPPNNCIATIKQEIFYACLNMGNPYIYGNANFSADVQITVKAFSGCTGGSPVETYTTHIIVNDTAPLSVINNDITGIAYGIERLVLVVNSVTYHGDPSKESSLQMAFYYTQNLSENVSNVKVANTSVTVTNPITFKWTSTCHAVPEYELQVLRLFNTDSTNAWTNEQHVKATVDWTQAEDIETGNSDTTYTMTLAEGRGYYLWRVRPIGTQYPGEFADSRNYGTWSTGAKYSTPDTVINLTGAVTPYIFFYYQFCDSLNWIYSRTFTEGDQANGKTRMWEKADFATSLLQMRQEEALLQSQKQVLIDQTLYDYSGRAAIKTLAAPVNVDSLGYQKGFIQGAANTYYNPSYFDQSSNYLSPAAVTNGTLNTYYSNSNSNSFISSAEGYPYSRSRYEPDATGRVIEQAGPGGTYHLQLTNSRTTRTYYGSVADFELIRMLGDEAPRDTTVHKVLNVDGNNTVTISYVDKEGKTIATCMSSGLDSTGAILDVLPEQANGRFHVTDTIYNHVAGGNKLVGAKSLAFASPTQVVFKYGIHPSSVSNTCPSMCNECDYKVTFSLRGNDTTLFSFSHILPADTCSHHYNWDTTFSILLNPGQYSVEKILQGNIIDPATILPADTGIGQTYEQVEEDTLQARYLRTATLKLDSVDYYLAHSNMKKLYSYLSINTSVNKPDSVFADSSVSFNIGCSKIKIPIMVCPSNSCSGGNPDFEGYFKSFWIDSTSYWTLVGGYLPYLNVFPDKFQQHQFNELIHNMLNDGYNCDSLWNCWKALVFQYPALLQLVKSNPGYKLDMLKSFLDCTGRKFKGSYKGVSDTAGYIGNAYKYFYNAKDSECYHIMKLKYGDSSTWHQDSLHGSLLNKKWEQYYDCIWSVDSNPYANNNVNPLSDINSAECTCNSACEARYDGFIYALIQMYHNDSIYVQGDKYYLVKDTNHDEHTYVPGLTPLPNGFSNYKSMANIRCAARDLVANCENGCNQTIYSNNGHVDSVGSPAQHLAMEESMTYSYTLALAPCAPGTIKIAPMPAQTIVWNSDFGSVDTDQVWDMVRDTVCEGSYLLAGWIKGKHGDVSDTLYDTVSYWAVKINQAGNKEWDKTYAGNRKDYLRAVVQMPDGGYMLGGYSNSGKANRKSHASYGGYDYWVVKTDANGNKVWDSTYGGSKNDILQAIHKTRDNKYLLIGYTNSPPSGNKSDTSTIGQSIWVVKIDSSGKKLWDKTYRPGAYYKDTCVGQVAVEAKNGDYIIGGFTNNKTVSASQGWGKYDYYVVKTDISGNVINTASYGGKGNDFLMDIAPDITDTNFFLVGSSDSASSVYGPRSDPADTNERFAPTHGKTDVWVVKIEFGTLYRLWDSAYGGKDKEGDLPPFRYMRIKPTIDTNFIIGAVSKSNVSGDKSHASYGGTDYWTFKINPSGNKIFDWTFGGAQEDYGTAIDQDDNGYYWIAGYSYSDSSGNKTVHNKGKSDYWVIKAQESCTHDTICFNWVLPSAVNNNDTIPYNFITCDSGNAAAIYSSVWSQVYNKIDSALIIYNNNYLSSCGNIKVVKDTFTAGYTLNYFHYTLYYYDRGGNLVRTVPPKGVILSSTSRSTHPADSLITDYWYNSLHQLIKQQTPDGGVTYFYYDYMGQLRFSQNALQRQAGAFSYTIYDQLGRVIEVGQSTDSTSFIANKVNEEDFPKTNNSQRTYTVYSVAGPIQGVHNDYQSFLQNRVSFTTNDDTVRTYYSYDPHGNVKWLVQALPGNMGRQYINYNYDQLSNKVLQVKYDSGARDGFYHRYYYDADQRLIQVLTTREMDPSGEIGHNRNVGWDADGVYKYYLHGPLQRLAMGQDSIQGLDYIYTLQGWLKGINYPTLTSSADPGGDGGTGRTMPTDLFSMVLGYDNDDFNRTSSEFLPTNSKLISSNGSTSFLYNGNISTWTENIKASGVAGNKYEQLNGYQYRYDQLNRITKGAFRNNGGSWTTPTDSDYLSKYTYDPNGNFNTLSRNAYDNPSPLSHMDYLTYHFNKGTNQLNYVTDTIPAGRWPSDIDNESANNYLYDSIGELTKDVANGLSKVTWTVYGKVKTIKKSNGDSLNFVYDAMNNRVEKTYVPHSGNRVTTFYVRDAQGNIMSTYKRTEDANNMYFYQTEEPLYGSDRLGEFIENDLVKTVTKSNYIHWIFWIPAGGTTFASSNIVPYSASVYTKVHRASGWTIKTIGIWTEPPSWWAIYVPNATGHYFRKVNFKTYELKDHLGDVRVTVSDRKDSANTTSQNPIMLAYNNNYAFGMAQPGRSYNLGNYRFSYNGKEHDDSIYGVDNSYDYGMRFYDPRLGRFLSTDPLFKKYPMLSTYQFATSNPIEGTDLDGKENFNRTDFYNSSGKLYKTELSIVGTNTAASPGSEQRVNKSEVHYDRNGNATIIYTGSNEGRQGTPSTPFTTQEESQFEINGGSYEIAPIGNTFETTLAGGQVLDVKTLLIYSNPNPKEAPSEDAAYVPSGANAVPPLGVNMGSPGTNTSQPTGPTQGPAPGTANQTTTTDSKGHTVTREAVPNSGNGPEDYKTNPKYNASNSGANYNSSGTNSGSSNNNKSNNNNSTNDNEGH